MRAAEIHLTVEHAVAADPSSTRRTAVALAVSEVTPEGVMVVDHGDAVSYKLPGGWVTASLPQDIRELVASFYAGRETAEPVTFGLYVPEPAEVAGA